MAMILSMIMFVVSSSVSTIPAYASMAKTSIKSVTATSGGFKLTWKKTSGVTGYQIQYSTSKSMKSAKTSKITKASSAMSIVECKSIPSGFYISWKSIDSYDKKITCIIQWSKNKNFSSDVYTKTITSPLDEKITSTAVYDTSDSMSSGKYYVRIKAKSSSGTAYTWSSLKTVTVTIYGSY
ncbi:MAG: hypothetical protein LUG95_08285 [Clostridiales bacterium]|nr:hypothetical protein [Clostridiales bacterium]